VSMAGRGSKGHATSPGAQNARLVGAETRGCPAERAGCPPRRAAGYLTSTVPFMLGCRPQMYS
jgi:hypothetical protein